MKKEETFPANEYSSSEFNNGPNCYNAKQLGGNKGDIIIRIILKKRKATPDDTGRKRVLYSGQQLFPETGATMRGLIFQSNR
jgi:hypothetical protein